MKHQDLLGTGLCRTTKVGCNRSLYDAAPRTALTYNAYNRDGGFDTVAGLQELSTSQMAGPWHCPMTLASYVRPFFLSSADTATSRKSPGTLAELPPSLPHPYR